MDDSERWGAAYGPVDGPWLRAKLAYVMSGVGRVHNVRVACMDDEAEMARYSAQVAAAEGQDQGEAGNWEVISPHTGKHYWMGCNW